MEEGEVSPPNKTEKSSEGEAQIEHESYKVQEEKNLDEDYVSRTMSQKNCGFQGGPMSLMPRCLFP